MSSLSDALAQFTTNYENGGIEACRTMVEDLAREAAAILATSIGTVDIQDEMSVQQDVLSGEEILARIELLNGATSDAIVAMARHSFVVLMLDALEKRESVSA